MSGASSTSMSWCRSASIFSPSANDQRHGKRQEGGKAKGRRRLRNSECEMRNERPAAFGFGAASGARGGLLSEPRAPAACRGAAEGEDGSGAVASPPPISRRPLAPVETAEQHGHELVSAREALGGLLGIPVANGPAGTPTRNERKNLCKQAGDRYHGCVSWLGCFQPPSYPIQERL